LKVGVNGGVIQIDRRQDNVKQRFCTFELAFQSLDILGGRVTATVRRLVICAFITVDGTVGAWLLAITFNLLASTFIASTRHTTPLLGLRFRCLIVAYVIGL
jgi:hypothetical protein